MRTRTSSRRPGWQQLLAVVVVILAPSVISFNLEPRIAIVKVGPAGSYFGYSVAQHQILDRQRLDSVALVGAPRDNSTQPGTTRYCSHHSVELETNLRFHNHSPW